MTTVVAGTFQDEEAAQRAIEVILDRHFNPAQISVLACADGEIRDVPVVHKTGVKRGAAVGAALGTVLGSLVLGPIALVGAGPALAVLQGAVAGAAAGTLTGALGGLGFWEKEADLQAEDLSGGAVWVGVEVEADNDTAITTAEAALREAGARRVARTRAGREAERRTG